MTLSTEAAWVATAKAAEWRRSGRRGRFSTGQRHRYASGLVTARAKMGQKT
jgi:hypothetical protein